MTHGQIFSATLLAAGGYVPYRWKGYPGVAALPHYKIRQNIHSLVTISQAAKGSQISAIVRTEAVCNDPAGQSALPHQGSLSNAGFQTARLLCRSNPLKTV
jgi:hypothetical protein